MTEYKGLQYKTRGNISPQGRPRVYFCCHEADFPRTFEPVTDEILAISPYVAFWYYDPSEGIPDDEDFFSDLSQMQLFVIPVTAKFVYQDNHARTVEFRYAVEHHIPVLPLMQDPGLEEDFNRVCGDLQFLDKYAQQTDPTALPYEEKLKKFLDRVLVSDELAAKIRAAFDAYIFLSYRKKDRRHAQEIMRLIHENEFARDIAIWYDEFLVPGENFNEAISAALEKSDLFALVVTPNLLENPNYIMTTEYPAAKASHKPILPVEAIPTDPTELSCFFDGIGRSLAPADIAMPMQNLLMDIALREHCDDPAHNYLIGLAYLSGIDVEVNHKRALELITSAAEANLPEALRKLVSMYNTGEGVVRDYRTAIEWQKRYVDYLRHKTEEEMTEKNLLDLYQEICSLAEWQMDIGEFQSAEANYAVLPEITEKMQQMGLEKAKLYLGWYYARRGEVCIEKGKLEEALDWYQKSAKLCRPAENEDGEMVSNRFSSPVLDKLGQLYMQKGMLDAALDCSRESVAASTIYRYGIETVSERIARINSYLNLGNVYEARCQLDRAEAVFQGALERAEELYHELGNRGRSKLSFVCIRLCRFYQENGNLDKARDLIQRSIELNESAVFENDTPSARANLSTGYLWMGRIWSEKENYPEARNWILLAIQLRESVVRETGSLQARYDLLVVYRVLGLLTRDEGNLSEAKEWLRKSLQLRESIAQETGTPSAKSDLAQAFLDLGVIYRREGNLLTARHWFHKARKLREEIISEAGTLPERNKLAAVYFNIGNTFRAEKKWEDARAWYLKSLKIFQDIADIAQTVDARISLADTYDSLSAISSVSQKDGKSSEAKDWLLKALPLRESVNKELQTLYSRRRLSATYYHLGETCRAEGTYPEAIAWYLSCIALDEAITNETGALKDRFALSVDYLQLGRTCREDKSLAEAKKWFLKCFELREAVARERDSRQDWKKLAEVCNELGSV